MGNFNLSRFGKDIYTAMQRHSPEILTGIGIAGMITTVFTAVRATPKAIRLIVEKQEDLEVNKLSPVDTFKTVWRCYIPSVVIGGMSIACLVGASSVNLRKNAALATAYTLSESALKEYQEKVIETIGEKREKEVRDDIDKDRVINNPVNSKDLIICGHGTTRCYEAFAGRYFESSIDDIKNAVHEANRDMRANDYISLNDLYYELKMDASDLGEEVGWHIDDGILEINFTSQLAADNVPCLVVNYGHRPKPKFRY